MDKAKLPSDQKRHESKGVNLANSTTAVDKILLILLPAKAQGTKRTASLIGRASDS